MLASERAYNRETIKDERDHATLKIGRIIDNQETMFKALCSRIQDLEASDRNHQQILERILKLEQKIETTTTTMNTALEILEESIANVNLKTQTKILYQEKLLYNLKQALFDTLSTIRNGKCASSATLQTTRKCTSECEPSDKPSPHPSTPPSPPEHAELNRDPTVIQHEEYETPIEVEEVLPQIDGNDSIEEDIIDITDSASLCAPFTFDPPPDSVSLPPNRTSSSRTARFTLNKEKQVLSLGADTKLADFDITVNDEDKNVLIQCSSAFYQAIAKPVLCGLEKQSTMNIENVPVTCHHIDYNRDRNGVEYNRVLHIHLGNSGRLSVGKITVHLHHTKRSIQMQGGAKMPDHNTAPVWFLQFFIKARFKDLAASKRVDIALFNKKIEDLVNIKNRGETNNSCLKCLKIFSRSSVPTICSYCRKYFHKSCLPLHSPSCSARQSCPPVFASTCSSSSLKSSTTLTSTMSTQMNIPFGASTSSELSLPQLSIPDPNSSPQPATTENTSKRRRLEQSQAVSSQNMDQPLISSGSLAFHPPQDFPQDSTLNPTAIPFTFPANNTQPNRKKNKAATVISPERAKLDFLNIELNSTKTKITHLESVVRDKDYSIKIQKEKIRLLEQNQHNNIQNSASQMHASPPQTCCGPPHPPTQVQSCYQPLYHQVHPCYHQLPQPCSHQHAHANDQITVLRDIKSALINIEEKVSNIDIQMNKMESKIPETNIEPNVANTSKPNQAEDRHPEHIAVVDVEIITNEETIPSDDEFVPDLPPDSTHLNYKGPTNQQSLLML